MYTNPLKKLTKTEWTLWIGSMLLLTISFLFVKDKNYLNLIMSLIGASTLIFLAKGDILGHILGIVFALLYAYVSFITKYYGELITYLFMTLPMSVFSLISWIKHPHNGSLNEVDLQNIDYKKWIIAAVLAGIVTLILHYILRALNTPNLIFATISITTSFFAAILTFYRSPYCCLAFAMNDIVLIILWILASIKDTSYVPIVTNFVIFFINDLYGFINWRRILKSQSLN